MCVRWTIFVIMKSQTQGRTLDRSRIHSRKEPQRYFQRVFVSCLLSNLWLKFQAMSKLWRSSCRSSCLTQRCVCVCVCVFTAPLEKVGAFQKHRKPSDRATSLSFGSWDKCRLDSVCPNSTSMTPFTAISKRWFHAHFSLYWPWTKTTLAERKGEKEIMKIKRSVSHFVAKESYRPRYSWAKIDP